MGKSRKARSNRRDSSPKENQKYKTDAGKLVDTDGHSKEWMEALEEKISHWVGMGEGSPSAELNKDEVDYIINHMEDSENNSDVPNGFLTRAEQGHHFLKLLENGLKEGDTLPSNSIFRSYSREQDSTYFYMHDWSKPVVIYRTNNNTPHFKATDFDDLYEDVESESYVQQNKLKVDKITRYNLSDYDDIGVNGQSKKFNKDIQKQLGIKGKNPSFNSSEIIFVDVSPTS